MNAPRGVPERVLLASALLTLGAFTYAFARWASFPYDLLPGEATPIYYAMRLLAGEPLYTSNDGFPYLYNVYPPLHVLVLAPLVAGFGPHLLGARLLSLLAAIAAAGVVAAWARAPGADRSARLAAGAAFLGSATMFSWLAMCRDDAFSTLLGCGTVALADGAARRRNDALLWLAAGLGVAAVFTRQWNPLLVIAAFLGAWPALRTRSLVALVAAGALSLAILLGLDASTGGAFWRSVSATVGWTQRAPFKIFHVTDYFVSQAGLAVLAVGTLVHAPARRSVPAGMWLGGAAGVYLMLEITRVGAGTNYFLPFHFFFACVAARMVAAAPQGSWLRGAATLVLAAQLLADGVALVAQAGAIPAGALANETRLERYLQGRRGPLLLDRRVALWLYSGRRDHFVEVAGLGIADYHGQARLEPLIDFVERRGYAAILLGPNTLMPPRVTAAIGRAYRAETRVSLWDGQYVLYTPARE